MEQALRQAGVTHDIAWTTGPGDGARIAAAAWQQGRARFLVAGGDGSVQGLVQLNTSAVATTTGNAANDGATTRDIKYAPGVGRDFQTVLSGLVRDGRLDTSMGPRRTIHHHLPRDRRS